MKITLEFLNKYDAYDVDIKYLVKENLIGLKTTKVINLLIKSEKLLLANWLIIRVLPEIDRVRYAVFAAEQVIDIFEKKYPEDDRPRKAIEAAKAYINNQSEETRKKAESASYAAQKASELAAEKGFTVWYRNEWNAQNAAHSAWKASQSVWKKESSAVYAVDSATHSAAEAVDGVWSEMVFKILLKIINNGIEILKGK
jgi:hypothetical protein